MPIRSENRGDFKAIGELHTRAFGTDAESRLVAALREEGFARVSLVADVTGQIVGHILFSALVIMTEKGPLGALSLAPLAVLPQWQRQGVGSQLVAAGLEAARQQGHQIVIVLGEPHFYGRFGFSAESARPLESCYAGDAFMALALNAGALDHVRGQVQYPAPFQTL